MNILTRKFPIAYIGLNPIKLFRFIASVQRLWKDYHTLKKQLIKNKDFKIKRLFLIADDKYDKSGIAKGHYFHQDLFIAQQIFVNKPKKHVDIWSRIDGFVAHVASFRSVEIYDLRPLENQKIHNITFVQCDLMWNCESLYDSTESISCLHTIEHFGLGRYGDVIDADWHIKWLDNLYKIVKKWWKFYFSTPIWPQRIE